jgi:hypothetical protein
MGVVGGDPILMNPLTHIQFTPLSPIGAQHKLPASGVWPPSLGTHRKSNPQIPMTSTTRTSKILPSTIPDMEVTNYQVDYL